MSDSRIELALKYCSDHQSEFVEQLSEILKIPSVSTLPERKNDMLQAAKWLAKQLEDLDFTKINIFSTEKHPVVFGQNLDAGAEAPTLLLYGHYDVQPTEPLDLWVSPPFVPTVRGENLYARGATDMKGQVVAILKSLESIYKTAGKYPVNLKFIIEGEEEIGSPSLKSFLTQYADLLKSDVAINLDAGMISADYPTITYGLRGLAYFEVRVFGPATDIHSGLYGGVIHNPAQVLCDLIAGMHDSQGHITLPDFYKKVRPISEKEHDLFSHLPRNEKTILQETGVTQLWGEEEYLPTERTGARPSLEVNGMLSGFTGAGAKTIIPAWSMAKISMRLVPDQDPKEVHQQLVKYLEQKAPKTVRWEVTPLSGAPASITDTELPATKAISKAFEAVWKTPPIFRREGGSIPVVTEMQQILGIDSVLSGFGLPDDNAHGPNEKLHLPTWYKGIQSLIYFFYFIQSKEFNR